MQLPPTLIALALPFSFALAAAAQTPSALPDAPMPTQAAQAYASSPEPTGPTAVFETSMGRLSCRLFSKEAPRTVANFIGLAEGTQEVADPKLAIADPSTDMSRLPKVKGVHFFDGILFHRVIPEFMVQSGDPTATGLGTPGYAIDDEIVPGLLFDRPGRLAMANSGPNTSGSQFFITEAARDTLNGSYSIFGQCDDASVTTVKAIARVPRDSMDKPLAPVVIRKVTIVRDPTPAPAAPSTGPSH